MLSGNRSGLLASILIILLVLFAAYISRFFIGTLMLSILLAYMLCPIYQISLGKIKSRQICSLLSVLTIPIAAILIYLVFYRSLSLEYAKIYESTGLAAKQAVGIMSQDIWQNLGLPKSFDLSTASEFKTNFPGGILPFAVSFVVPTVVQEAIDVWIFPAIQGWLLNFAIGFPNFVVQVIISMFLAYHFLLTGWKEVKSFPNVFSGSEKVEVHYFLKELNGLLKTLFTTNFDIAAFNALIGMIIFSLLGMPQAIILASVAAFFSLVRFLGPWLVFVPISIYFFSINDFPRGFLVLFFGLILLEYVPEHLLRPRIAIDRSRVNIIIEFVSYVAPIFVLGPIGIVIGPFIFALLIAVYRTTAHFNLLYQRRNCHENDL